MKASEALTRIEFMYGWKLSRTQTQIFVELMRQTKNPQQVIDNWAIYCKEIKRSPTHFKEWFGKNVNIEETCFQKTFPKMKWDKQKQEDKGARNE